MRSKEAILEEIRTAFKGVTRLGGVSWTESIVIDGYGSEAERQVAREKDTEQDWMQLTRDSSWKLGVGIGGLSFLDPIGFRYYLPAAMILNVMDDDRAFETSLAFHLTLPKRFLRSYTLDQWSRLDDSQRMCVKHFIEFMIDRFTGPTEETGYFMLDTEWREAYDSYWKGI